MDRECTKVNKIPESDFLIWSLGKAVDRKGCPQDSAHCVGSTRMNAVQLRR